MSTGHPARHGFARCTYCGAWSKAEHVEEVKRYTGPIVEVEHRCTDRAWCAKEIKLRALGADGLLGALLGVTP